MALPIECVTIYSNFYSYIQYSLVELLRKDLAVKHLQLDLALIYEGLISDNSILL